MDLLPRGATHLSNIARVANSYTIYRKKQAQSFTHVNTMRRYAIAQVRCTFGWQIRCHWQQLTPAKLYYDNYQSLVVVLLYPTYNREL